jgi:hypothetical protein
MVDKDWIPQDKGFSLYIRRCLRLAGEGDLLIFQALPSLPLRKPLVLDLPAMRCCLSSAAPSAHITLVSSCHPRLGRPN